MKGTLSIFVVSGILTILFGFNMDKNFTGCVLDARSGQAVQNAKITLITEGIVSQTDADGLFKIRFEVKLGDRIEIRADGYRTLNAFINHSSFQTFMLVPMKSAIIHIEQEKDQGTIIPAQSTKREYGFMQMNRADQRVNDSYYPSVQTNESYDNIVENDWRLATDHPYSTFSIDVDAASYSNVRRFLNQGILPPPDAVRIEEMINYFDYDFPEVRGGQLFSTNMELGKCPWNEDHQLLHIGIKGKNLEDKALQPSNLVFLIDVSGSMRAENKLPLLKRAFTLLLNNLGDHDKISIVTYAGTAGIQLEAAKSSDKHDIYKMITKLHAGGSTAGASGITTAYQLASKHFLPEGNNRVILATDGDFNVGLNSDQEMVKLIEGQREKGIFLTVLGFGMGNYKDSKMQKLADHGNGFHAYIDNFHEARKIFQDELQASIYTIAKDVKIQIEFNPAYAQAYRLIGYENRQLKERDFNDDSKDAGEIGAGHTITALYEIVPIGSDLKKVINIDPLRYQSKQERIAGIQNNELAHLKIRYKEPMGTNSKMDDWILQPLASKDTPDVSSEFKWSASMAVFGLMLRESPFKENASYEMALQLAEEGKASDRWGYRAEAINLIRTASSLSAQRNVFQAEH